MRTKNGKRIGPVPIAVVAVFALAALLSAGLLALIPGSTQAQSATGRLPDVTLDVGQGSPTIATLSNAADTPSTGDPAVSRAFPVGATGFTIESDQDDPSDDLDLQNEADKNGGIETENSGNNRANAIEIDETSGEITIPAGIAGQGQAEQADNTARITVKAKDAQDNALQPVRFNLTIVQNPFERNGTKVANPTGWTDATSSDCAVQADGGSDLTSRAIDIDTPANALVDGGKCTTAGNSVDVDFRNIDSTPTTRAKSTFLVYVTGGSSYSKVDGFEGKSGLNQELLEVDGQNVLSDPGEETITVSRSMADKNNQVYLYGYFGGTLGDKRTEATDEAFSADADFVVRVQFVDGPALAFDANRDDKAFDPDDGTDGDVNGSTLKANNQDRMGDSDGNKDGYDDGMYMIDSGSDAEIEVEAIIKDANGNPLNAGDKDSRVDFSVMYVAGSDISDSAANYNSRKVIPQGDNNAPLMVGGWNDSSKAVRVMVSATYTSPLAPNGFDLGTVTLIRVADFASSADFGTYTCVKQDNTQFAAAKGCMTGYKAKADMRFGREEHFVVFGEFQDSLGSTTTDRPEVDLSDDAEDTFDVTVTTADSFLARSSAGSVLVQVKDDAAYGDYTITVTNGESGDDEVTQELMVYVAGPIDSITLEGPDNIELNGSATYKVTAMDENGGVPDFDSDDTAKDNLVEVAVQPVTALVTGREPDGQLKLDPETGMAYFTVYAALNASDGDAGRIIVGQGDMQQIMSITFGMMMPEVVEPGPEMDDELRAPTGVLVTSLRNTISVIWTKDPNAQVTKVVLFNEDVTEILDLATVNPANDDGSHTFTGLDAGTYQVAVASFRAGDGHKISDRTTVEIK